MNYHPCFKCGSFDHTYHPSEDKMRTILGYEDKEWIVMIKAIKGCSYSEAEYLLSNAIADNYYYELADIRNRYETKQERKSKMTREEAIRKMMQIFRSDVDDSKRNIADFVDGLEALGLITFNNKPPMVVRFDTKAYPNGLVIMLDGKVISP